MDNELKISKPRDDKGRFKKYLSPNVKQIPICKNCGDDFTRNSGNQLYCNACFNINVKCDYCSNVKQTRRTLYDYHKKNNSLGKFFCSKLCRTNWEKENRNETRFCKECENVFVIWKSSKQNFCSRKCYDIWQNTQEIRVCLWCKEEFKTQHNSKQTYCSKRCGLARNGETSIEILMRKELDKKEIKYRQYEKIGRFFVDFYLPKINTIIECDGIHWHSKPEVIERDKRKNEYLKNNGYILYRFTDKEINSDVKDCVDKIKELG